MMRWLPLVEVTMPAFALPTVTFGLPQFTVSKRLNASTRISIRRPPAMFTLRENARSVFHERRTVHLSHDRTLPHTPGELLRERGHVEPLHPGVDASRIGNPEAVAPA